MPMIVNLGLTKKHGLPDYGSVGASCSVSMELESTLLQQDLEAFHRRVRDAYVACTQAVNDELARHHDNQYPAVADRNAGQPVAAAMSHSPSIARPNGEAARSGSSNGHQPTPKQLEYINQLARQVKGLGVRRLETLTQQMFDKPLTDLSSFEASALIDQLKAIKAGQINLDDVLADGAAA